MGYIGGLRRLKIKIRPADVACIFVPAVLEYFNPFPESISVLLINECHCSPAGRATSVHQLWNIPLAVVVECYAVIPDVFEMVLVVCSRSVVDDPYSLAFGIAA